MTSNALTNSPRADRVKLLPAISAARDVMAPTTRDGHLARG